MPFTESFNVVGSGILCSLCHYSNSDVYNKPIRPLVCSMEQIHKKFSIDSKETFL